MAYYKNMSGLNLWYEEEGSGVPLVLLHGWCKSSSVWRLQLDSLSSDFRVIAPDLAGYGKSESSSGKYELESYVDDLWALFKTLSLQNAILVGWSQGGQIAMQACSRLREHLSGLVLVSTTPRFTAGSGFQFGLTEFEAQGMIVKVRRNLSRALDGFNVNMFASGELESCPEKQSVLEILSSGQIPSPDTAIQGLHLLYGADLRSLLPSIDLPVLIVSGDSDGICLPEASLYLSENIAGSSRAVIAGCGHAPFLTKYKNFNDIICKFIRENPSFVR
jgi:pimeloyl-ACP methyl ester esterase